MVGVIGPIGSGLPQFGFPRRLAMKNAFPLKGDETANSFSKLVCQNLPIKTCLSRPVLPNYMILRVVLGIQHQAGVKT
jgi:hypothetical protein